MMLQGRLRADGLVMVITSDPTTKSGFIRPRLINLSRCPIQVLDDRENDSLTYLFPFPSSYNH